MNAASTPRIPTADDVFAAAERLQGPCRSHAGAPLRGARCARRAAGAPEMRVCFQHGGSFKFSRAPSTDCRDLRPRSARVASSLFRPAITRRAWRSRRAAWASRRPSSCPPTHRPSSSPAPATTAPPSSPTTASARAARPSPLALLSARERPSSRRSTIPTSSPARAPAVSSSSHRRGRRALSLEAVLTAASGGGLAAGLALALGRLSPTTHLYTVEPDHFDDHVRSLEAGERLTNAPGAASMCDALMSPTPGVIPLRHKPRTAGRRSRRHRGGGRPRRRLCRAGTEARGRAGAAPSRSPRCWPARRRARGPVGLVLSGGNIDPEVLTRCLSEWPEP